MQLVIPGKLRKPALIPIRNTDKFPNYIKASNPVIKPLKQVSKNNKSDDKTLIFLLCRCRCRYT